MIQPDCSLDIVTPVDKIADQTYLIGFDGTVSYEPKWTQSKPYCPVEYEFTRLIGGSVVPMTLDETKIISFNESDGSLTLSTDDLSMHGLTWTLSITMKSTRSEQPDGSQYLFNINFRDACWDAELKPA